MVSNTSELLPEPETPVNTVSRRFGISRLTSLRLFTRAPCTRIRPWLSATCGEGDCGSVVGAGLIGSPSCKARAALAGSVGGTWLDSTSMGWMSDSASVRFLEPVGAARQRARPPGHPSDQPRHSVRLAGFEPATPA